MKTDFHSPVSPAEFSKFAGILSVVLSQHHLSGFKRRLLLGRKVMTNLDSIFKSRDITLPTKVMYGCESWTIKKADHQRIDDFNLWCWRRLESPLDCKEIQPVHPKGDQSWVFIGRPDVEAETTILRPPDAKS